MLYDKISKPPISQGSGAFHIFNALLPLHHLIELQYITFHNLYISLEVDTTVIAFFDFCDIEWAHLQVRDFSGSSLRLTTDNSDFCSVLDLSSCHSHTDDHHRVIFSSVEYRLHE
jgi:hypothetical protein